MLDVTSVSGFPDDPLPKSTAASASARALLAQAPTSFGTGANNRTKRVNGTAASNANANASGLAYANWGNGPIGLHTNTPPSTSEFLTVQRVDMGHFYLLAPNQKFLVLNPNGSLTASAATRSLATLFNVTQVSGTSAFQTSRAEYVCMF